MKTYEENFSENIYDNSIEVLRSCHEYYYRLIPGIERLIDDLKNYNKSSMRDLYDTCEGIAWICSALIMTARYHHVNTDDIEQINSMHKAISEGLENNDLYYIAEVLQNESLPILMNWFEIIDKDLNQIS